MGICLGPECDRPGIKRGLCGTHYSQNKNHGFTWVIGSKPKPGRRACEFPDCGRPNFAHGLCAAHAKQKRLGIELRPVRAPRPTAAEGYNWCSTCKQFWPIEDFPWDKSRNAPQRVCHRCKADRQSEWARENYLTRRWQKITKAYGLTRETFRAMFDEQGGRCWICRVELADLRDCEQDARTKTAIDHNHDTGVVRGLLCGPCNCAIGYMQDDPARLESAATYLRRAAA